MSERNDPRDESTAAPVAAEAMPPAVSDAPALAPVEQAEDANIETKLPHVAEAPEATPVAATTPVVPTPVAATASVAAAPPVAVPPPFLREHETRVVTTKAKATKATATKPVAATKDKPKSKFPLLAATLALAAAIGGATGAIGVPTAIHMAFGAPPAAPAGETADVQALKAVAAQLSSEIATLRAATEQSSKTTTTQFTKIGERLDRAERAQAEPTTKLAKIGEAVERLERRAAAPATPAHADVTGSVTPPEAKPKPTILEDYVVRKVFDGVALVEGRRGIVEVEPGSTLPGAGRVEEIRRQDGRWVVVTSKGLIAPPR